jgi:hypothetical protein
MRKHVKHLAAALTVGLLASAPAYGQGGGFTVPGTGLPTAQGRAFWTVQDRYKSFIPTQLQRDSLRQWAFNTAVIGRTYARLPPWLFGYNPYPPQNYGPVYQPVGPAYPPPVYGGGGGYTNPYAGGYGGGYGGGYTNPYGGGYGGGGYTSGYGGYDPGYGGGGYYGDPYGGYLRGSAEYLGAVGNLSLQQEQARMLREMAIQAKLDTRKKAFDLAAYIRDNTPTFTQEQARIQKQTLARLQTNATYPEIVSGKAPNFLLKDLSKFVGRKSPVNPIQLEEDTLSRLNVTKSFGNLGLLRNKGEFTWPTGLRGLTTPEERTALEKETQRVFKRALVGNLDGDGLRDLKNDVSKIRDKLTRSVNDVGASQYIDAQRFLNDFDSALVALERQDAVSYFNFHKQFSSGGPKTVQELVDYMTRQGLAFAPAVVGDEGAYQALQDALVSYSVAMENSGGSKE